MTKTIAKVVAVAAMAAGMVFAQPMGRGGRMGQGQGMGPGMGMGAGMGMGQGMGGGMLGARMLATLNLTDAQKEQIKSIQQTAQQSASLLQPDLKLQQEALQQAVKLNDSAKMKAAATALGSLHGQMEFIHATARASIYALLTPDQKANLDQRQQKLQGAAKAARQALR